jgi:hypothetical protein
MMTHRCGEKFLFFLKTGLAWGSASTRLIYLVIIQGIFSVKCAFMGRTVCWVALLTVGRIVLQWTAVSSGQQENAWKKSRKALVAKAGAFSWCAGVIFTRGFGWFLCKR